MAQRFGSDVVVELLDRLEIAYVALNPGASFRGFHDSLAAAGRPEGILALFEGTAVAIAHGYAKSSGRPMGVALHNLVGLQHATMAVFNAWADHVPALLIGGSGPADHVRRRPWIDWVHTPNQQAEVVRPYVKWDAQPVSIAAFPEVLLRAHQLATAAPQGPTYVAIDALLQEQPAPDLDLSSFSAAAAVTVTAPPDALARVADLLVTAEHPVLVADFVGRSRAGFDALRELAELLAAPVVDLGARHCFPTGHWADCALDRTGQLAAADVVLALDCRDVRWAVSKVDHNGRSHTSLLRPDARLAVITLNELQHHGFLDLEPPITADELLVADTAVALPALVELVAERRPDARARRARLTAHTTVLHEATRVVPPPRGERLHEGEVAAALWAAVRDGPWQLGFSAFRNWPRRTWDLHDFGCHLGGSGGAGLGYGMGATIGAALHHRDDDVLVVGLQPDGDALYTASALWTAAHHRLPLLIVVLDNGTYGADRLHQLRMTGQRGGPAERATEGIDFADPAIDHAALARAQGVEGFGPVTDRAQLGQVLARAVRYVREESLPAVVDVVVAPPEASGI